MWRCGTIGVVDGSAGAVPADVARGLAAEAAKGRPHGRVPFGYERVFDGGTGKLAGQRPDPVTAPVVREIVQRAGAGDAISTIAADLNERGIPTPLGREWHRGQVRKIAMSPAYAGKRVHKGELFDAMWPALVTDEEHFAVVRRFADPDRPKTRPGRSRYLLSYLATCGECGRPLKGIAQGTHRKHALYSCERGHSYARMDDMDAFVVGRWRELASGAGFRERLARQREAGDVAARARREAEGLRRRLDELARMAAAGEIAPRRLAVAEAELAPRIRELERLAASVPAVAPFTDAEAASDWEEIPLARRRELLGQVFSRIALRGRPGRGHAFDPGRVVLELRAGS